jgi:[protein-PII] uridylyltransferase
MLTLFTYADISAVHPDALTPWKAENLWRLSMAASNQLDRSVDEERVHADGSRAARAAETVARTLGRSAPERAAIQEFLEGFPERYLRTRSPETIRQHVLAMRGEGRPVLLRERAHVYEITMVTGDRPHLFADLTAVLAAWGMDVVSAEAFSNAEAIVVDTFRFTDAYRTLELNPEERDRFVAEMEAVLKQGVPPDRLNSRRRARHTAPRREIETHIGFDNTASSHSTLIQIATRDVPGLLRTTASTLSEFGCSVEVALIDTEGEVAIDVFYVTRDGRKLEPAESNELTLLLTAAIEANAR